MGRRAVSGSVREQCRALHRGEGVHGRATRWVFPRLCLTVQVLRLLGVRPNGEGWQEKTPPKSSEHRLPFASPALAVECRAPGDPWWGSCPRTWAGRSKGLSLKQLHCIWEAPPCRHPGTLSPRRSSTCAPGPSPTPDGPGRPTTEPPAPRPRWPPKGRVPDEDALEWGISHAGHWSTRRLGLLPRLVRTVPTQDAARTHAGRTEDSPRIGARAEEAPRPAP
jgi:hypothetical protein